ncbi:hypothetical protein [Pseudonocardia alaniniphila]|uniref:DUF222 domain-containing protein n=1 Tax=Pseudonocardia alaniniphila TaxID=75291 RepID=A0ABS9TIU5_9PSEU|nr:hypothetical protein [Pseudonocardia alaniniphila]MCH6168462.1 hypothetical protein [Pseudonocardia alaniniphila]
MPDDPDETAEATDADLDAVAENLYGVLPDDFIAERDAAAARARERGDRELAKAIGRLRRPTRAAWLANLLARHRREQLDGLLSLAAGLADAQRTLDGAALRRLSSTRNQLVAAMAREAGRLAMEAGDPAAESVLRELQGILDAALARPEIAEQVRSGRLTRTLSYTGFGPDADPDAWPMPAVREAPSPQSPAPTVEADPAEIERAERERAERARAERERRERAVAEAEAEEDAARAQQHTDEDARDAAVEARDAARDRVAELIAELDTARDRERTSTASARDAETAARASARAAGAAATRTARARARLDEL